MEKSKVGQKALWANVIFAELSAAAFLFLRGKLAFIDELSGGQSLLFGIEFLILAALATYTALRHEKSRPLTRVIIGLNVVLFGYFLETLIFGKVSAMATEVLLIDLAVVAGLIVAQVVGLRAVSQKNSGMLVS